MTIYLYVKTHRKTGLKYLGKTESKDPHKYRGSGVYWQRHIKEHGYDVDTEILRECQSNEEVRQWGLYYSQLWQIIDSNSWANLKEETGDGWTSEQSREVQRQRVVDGSHNFSGGEIARQNTLKRVADGTHNFLGGEIQRQRVANGTHPFLGGELQKQTMKKRVKNGTHNFLGGEIQKQTMKKRVADGTHNLVGGEITRKQLANGTHPSQTQWTCPHCGKSGKGTGAFTRWHGDKCKDN